jgi:hypothetical protein
MRTHLLRSRLLAPILCVIGGALFAPLVQGRAPWTEALTQQALSSGFLTRLPPTVSVALGLAKAQEGTEVRQLLSKAGHQVRTFNVSVANHGDLVVFNIDARSGATVAYLVGSEGKLRKAVSYQAGAEAREVAAADAQTGLTREARFWAARAHKAAPSSASDGLALERQPGVWALRAPGRL